MIDPKKFLKSFEKNGVDFFSGVPDSLMKDFCKCLDDKKNHIAAVNEGSAIGLGVGYYLASKKIPLIYFQNSGLGNAINPIVSLVHKKIFKIPLFLLIGWRGETRNKKKNLSDEPQHLYQGLITEKLLKILQIKYKIINSKTDFNFYIKKLLLYSKKNSTPVAFLVRKNTFLKYKNKEKTKPSFLKRKEILQTIVQYLPKKTNIVSTTGVLSRELMELTNNYDLNNFYCVGGMGHSISISGGVAFVKGRKKILCLDGDGSALMHLGAQVYSKKMNNIIHILINNGVHDSVGAQQIASKKINFFKLANELGYKKTFLCNSKKQIIAALKFSLKYKFSTFIEVISSPGYNKNLIRPNKPMKYYKDKFMKGLNS